MVLILFRLQDMRSCQSLLKQAAELPYGCLRDYKKTRSLFISKLSRSQGSKFIALPFRDGIHTSKTNIIIRNITVRNRFQISERVN